MLTSLPITHEAGLNNIVMVIEAQGFASPPGEDGWWMVKELGYAHHFHTIIKGSFIYPTTRLYLTEKEQKYCHNLTKNVHGLPFEDYHYAAGAISNEWPCWDVMQVWQTNRTDQHYAIGYVGDETRATLSKYVSRRVPLLDLKEYGCPDASEMMRADKPTRPCIHHHRRTGRCCEQNCLYYASWLRLKVKEMESSACSLADRIAKDLEHLNI